MARNVTLRDIVSAVKAEGGYHEWGHAPLFLAPVMEESGSVADARQLSILKGRYCLLQFARMTWKRFEREERRHAHEGGSRVVKESFIFRIVALLWRAAPSMMNAQVQERLKAFVQGCSTNPRIREKLHEGHLSLLDSPGHFPLWVMPEQQVSTHALLVESLWDQLGYEIPLDLAQDMLFSATDFLEEVCHRAEAAGIQATLSSNAVGLAQYYGLKNTAGLEWMALFESARRHEKIQSILTGFSAFLPKEWLLFLCDCEQSLGLPDRSLLDVFGNFGLAREISGHWLVLKEVEEFLTEKQPVFSSSLLEKMGNFYISPGKFIEDFLCSVGAPVDIADALPPEAFDFLGQDWVNLVALLKSNRPMRALVVGEGSCGKTALVKAAGAFVGRECIAPTSTTEGPSYFQTRLANLHRRNQWNPGSFLMIDGADGVLGGAAKENQVLLQLLSAESHSYLSAHEVWTVQRLKDIDASVLHAFDLVVRLGAMPLARRKRLAESLFGPGDLAGRVAQACVTPGEIQSLFEWAQATGQSDWNSLSSRLTSVQQAVLSTKNNMGELPVSCHPPQSNHGGFSDVVGQPVAVRQARRAVACLRDPEGAKALGGKAPRGILLKGGPGMGKTHLARAMAGEAGVPLLLADSAAMAQSPELIGAVFAEARRQAPCLLFLDELDAIGTVAKGAMGGSPDPKRQAILNRLLIELSGFTELEGVLVVGATHRSELLDDALVRSGRLGLHLHLEEPNRQAREDIWRHYAKDVACADVIPWERLGRISAGMSPADIAQAVNQAALLAFGDEADRVGYKHFVDAVDQVLWKGDEIELPLLENERWRTAVHEAGHALLAWHAGLDIERVSIRPRGMALGFVRTLPEEGRYGLVPENIVGELAMIFGGLAAETVILGNHSTGVSSDLKQARRLARLAVRVAGMEESLPGGVADPYEPAISEGLRGKAEELENQMLAKLRASAIQWISEHREVLEAFARLLVQEREMDGQEVQVWLDGRLKRTVSSENVACPAGVLAAAQSWPSGIGALAAKGRAPETS